MTVEAEGSQRIRRGFSLVVREDESLERLVPAVAEAGFDGIEPTFLDQALPSPSDPVATARRLAARCRDLGLAIPSLRGGAVPWSTVASNDEAERQAAVEHVRRGCDALSEMGASLLLIVPGRREPDVDYHTHWRRVVDFARNAGDIAREHGVSIALENVEGRFPVSELDWCALIDEIDHDRVGMYLDVGNVLWLGFGYPEQWIRTLGDRILQVHFKDAVYSVRDGAVHAEIRHVLDGQVNWPAVMKALSDVSYQGWISLEPKLPQYYQASLPTRLLSAFDTVLGAAGRS